MGIPKSGVSEKLGCPWCEIQFEVFATPLLSYWGKAQ